MTNFHFGLSQREDVPELLEQGEGAIDEVELNFADMDRSNRWLGGRRAMKKHLLPRLAKQVERRPVRILDVACGAGHMMAYLEKRGRRQGTPVELVGVDLCPRHLSLARGLDEARSVMRWTAGDALSPPFAQRSFDYVWSSLFLHHLSPEQLREALPRWAALARHALVLNDISRDGRALAFYQLAKPFLARCRLSRHDAPASIRRAYTAAEIREIAAEAGLTGAKVKVDSIFLRFTLIWERA